MAGLGSKSDTTELTPEQLVEFERLLRTAKAAADPDRIAAYVRHGNRC